MADLQFSLFGNAETPEQAAAPQPEQTSELPAFSIFGTDPVPVPTPTGKPKDWSKPEEALPQLFNESLQTTEDDSFLTKAKAGIDRATNTTTDTLALGTVGLADGLMQMVENTAGKVNQTMVNPLTFSVFKDTFSETPTLPGHAAVNQLYKDLQQKIEKTNRESRPDYFDADLINPNATGFGDLLGDTRKLADPGFWVQSTINGITQMLPALTAAALTGGGSTAMWAGATAGAAQEVAGYTQELREAGESPEAIRDKSMSYFFAVTLLEKAGLDGMFKRINIPQDSKLIPAIAKIAVGKLYGAGIEATSEYAEELSQGVIDAIGKLSNGEGLESAYKTFAESARKGVNVIPEALGVGMVLGGSHVATTARPEATPTPTPAPTPEQAPAQSPPLYNTNLKWSPAYTPEISQFISDRVAKYGGNETDKSIVDLILHKETGGGTVFHNDKSGADGWGQIIPSTAAALGIAGKTGDAQTNLDATVRLYMDNKKMLSAAGIPLNPLNMYLAHQQGTLGLSTLLKVAQGVELGPKEQKHFQTNFVRNLMANFGKSDAIDDSSPQALAQSFIQAWARRMGEGSTDGTNLKISDPVMSRESSDFAAYQKDILSQANQVTKALGEESAFFISPEEKVQQELEARRRERIRQDEEAARAANAPGPVDTGPDLTARRNEILKELQKNQYTLEFGELLEHERKALVEQRAQLDKELADLKNQATADVAQESRAANAARPSERDIQNAERRTGPTPVSSPVDTRVQALELKAQQGIPLTRPETLELRVRRGESLSFAESLEYKVSQGQPLTTEETIYHKWHTDTPLTHGEEMWLRENPEPRTQIPSARILGEPVLQPTRNPTESMSGVPVRDTRQDLGENELPSAVVLETPQAQSAIPSGPLVTGPETTTYPAGPVQQAPASRQSEVQQLNAEHERTAAHRKRTKVELAQVNAEIAAAQEAAAQEKQAPLIVPAKLGRVKDITLIQDQANGTKTEVKSSKATEVKAALTSLKNDMVELESLLGCLRG